MANLTKIQLAAHYRKAFAPLTNLLIAFGDEDTPKHLDALFDTLAESHMITLAEARLDELDAIRFIQPDGQETHLPFTMYRWAKNGQLLSWEDRQNELNLDIMLGKDDKE